MASIISAGTTSGTAIAITGDTTGNLAFQTSAGTYTQTMPNVTGNIVTTGDTGTVTATMVSTSASAGFGLCKAWVNFGYVSSAMTTRASYNVSSVTRNGTGDYTITFTNAFSDANYAGAAVSAQDAAGNRNVFANFPYSQVPTTTTARVGTCAGNNATMTDAQYVNFAFFR